MGPCALYPIVTWQYSSTTLYQVPYHIQQLSFESDDRILPYLRGADEGVGDVVEEEAGDQDARRQRRREDEAHGRAGDGPEHRRGAADPVHGGVAGALRAAIGGGAIKRPSPLSALKDAYDHSCYCARSEEYRHGMTPRPMASNTASVQFY